jgi:hypothetical protein
MRAGSCAGNATRACHAATLTATTALAHACTYKTPDQDRQGHEGETCIQTARTIQRPPIALYAATSPVGRIGAVVAGVPGGCACEGIVRVRSLSKGSMSLKRDAPSVARRRCGAAS